MKELSIEQKAKAYDKTIEKLRTFYRDYDTVSCLIDVKEELANLFPELKESEDERIRKLLIEAVIQVLQDQYCSNRGVSKEKVVAWLEKQGKQSEQKPTTEMKSAEESLGIDSDTYNKIVDECIYGDDEQKLADKIEPKFKVGQTIKKEGFNLGFPIVKIEDGFYYNDMGDYFPFTDQDNWELVEQKPADWSEEDEMMLDTCIDLIEHFPRPCGRVIGPWKDCIDWLKSLKERYTWKPSEEQIASITCAVRKMKESACYDSELVSLFNDLKKLKG